MQSYIDRTFQILEEQKQVCLQQNELEPSAVILCLTVGILVPDPILTIVQITFSITHYTRSEVCK